MTKYTFDDFIYDFTRLCFSKGIKFKVDVAEVYWEDLENMPYLHETLSEAKRRSYFRDHSQAIPRIPTVSEILELYKEILPRMKNEEAKNTPLLPQPKPNRQIRSEGIFMCDLVGYFNCRHNEILVNIKSGEIVVPTDYFEQRNKAKDKKAYIQQHFGKEINSLTKHKSPKSVDGFNTLHEIQLTGA